MVDQVDIVIVTLCPTKECVGAFMADLAGRIGAFPQDPAGSW